MKEKMDIEFLLHMEEMEKYPHYPWVFTLEKTQSEPEIWELTISKENESEIILFDNSAEAEKALQELEWLLKECRSKQMEIIEQKINTFLTKGDTPPYWKEFLQGLGIY